ncbi:hypothetical protein V6N12_016276 [Hibiscus sabdariffa]|uniref:Uncharacterized protein n=1 Tax=Hibiscus sabdariffa TaxID=183260 RepID=A0ABR2CD48_9ROSI
MALIMGTLELNDTVRIGQRVFDIYINDEKKEENFDTAAGSNYREVRPRDQETDHDDGDPCLLEPWQGMACNSINGSTVITDLDISNNELEGSLPDSLISLHHLSTLYYGCNYQLDNDLPSTLNISKLTTESGACPRKLRGRAKGIVIGSAVVTLALGTIVWKGTSKHSKATSGSNRFSIALPPPSTASEAAS